MKKQWRIVAFLLAMLMLLPCVAACKKKEQSEEQTTQGATESVSDDAALYDENGYLKDSLPPLDFDGYAFHMLGWNSGYGSDFFSEIDVGDTVIDSVYFRNIEVQSRLNVQLTAEFIDGDNATQSQFVEHATNAVLAGGACDYDLIGSYSMCGGTLATSGVVCDLLQLPYLDYTKPWWSSSLVEMSKINNGVYFVTGDAANSFIYNLYFLIVNKDMLKALGLEDPRTLVQKDQWTLEKLMNMTSAVYSDDDQIQGKSEGDRFGFVSYSQVHMDSFLAASGIRMADQSSGSLALTEDFLGQKTHDLIQTLNNFFWSTNDCAYATEFGYKNIFNGNALFGAVAGSTVPTFRDVTWEYGIVPYPKVYEGQSSYYTNLGFAYTNFSIPKSAKDPDMSAAVLECMGSESHRSSAPALFETVLKSRFAKDALDAPMYDIIRESVYIDANRVFSSSFVWTDSAVFMFRNSIVRNDNNWISNIEAKRLGINAILASISSSVS